MPNLLVTYEKITAPPAECSQEPPAPTKTDPKPKDGCYFTIPLIDDGDKNAAPRTVRFDRQGDAFVLSPSNSADDLTWVGNRGNLAGVTDSLRITGKVLQLLVSPASENTFRILLTITQYVSTGTIRFGEYQFNPEIHSADGDSRELASYLLEIFSYNPEVALAKLLGVLSVTRGETGVSKQSAERIKWIQDVYGLRTNYQKFRKHFTDFDLFKMDFEKTGAEEKQRVAWLFAFCRRAVIDAWLGRSFKYDELFVQVLKDFPNLENRKKSANKAEFCDILETALRDIGVELPETFKADCLAAFQLAQMKPEAAIKQSIKRGLLDEGGRAFMQNEVKEESDRANMEVNWLFARGRLGEVADAMIKNLKIQQPQKSGDTLRLELDFTAFSSELSVVIAANTTIQREYILSSLALLRRLFDGKGQARSLRVFLNGEFTELPLSMGQTPRADVVDYMKGLKRKLALSETRSEKWLPRVEASLCGAGIAGLAFSEGLMEDGGELQRGVGISSAGVAGAGCAALAGHYFWPKVATVRNRYAWEGLTGAAGSVLGVGLYWLAKSVFGSDSGSPIKYPSDEYGP